MSADNGIMIRKLRSGKFEVREYCASVDYEFDEDMTLIKTVDTIEEAIIVGQGRRTEYGLCFDTGSLMGSPWQANG